MPPHAASRNRSATIRQPANDRSATAALAKPPAAPAVVAADAKSQQNSEMPSAANGTSRADTSPCSSLAHWIEPTPTPTANTVSSSVNMLPPDCSVSRATTGNSVSKVAPMVQNHDNPSTDSQSGRIDAAWRSTRQVSANRLGDRRSVGSAAGSAGMHQAAARPNQREQTRPSRRPAPRRASAASRAAADAYHEAIDRKVVPHDVPLPATSSPSARCSGSTPYFTGPNSAACTPSANSTPSNAATLAVRKATAAAIISNSSSTL